MNLMRRCRNHRDALVKWVYDLKKALPDLLHKPGHVKGRDIRSSGGGEDELVVSFHVKIVNADLVIYYENSSFFWTLSGL